MGKKGEEKMENSIFNKYLEIINFSEKKGEVGSGPLLNLHFPWAVKILNVRYELSLQKEALIFVRKNIELETHIVYPYLPWILVFFKNKEKVNFWYKLEAEEKNQIVLVNKEKEGIVPKYLLSRKAEIIREAILEQTNSEKFVEEFKKNILNNFAK